MAAVLIVKRERQEISSTFQRHGSIIGLLQRQVPLSLLPLRLRM